MGYQNEKGQWESDSTTAVGRYILPAALFGFCLFLFLLGEFFKLVT